MQHEYILIELCLFVILFLVHWHFSLKLFSSKRQFGFFWLISLTIGIVWDHFAIVRGHWIYPVQSVIGLFLWNIPIEDYLFIVLYPYYALVVYRLVSLHRRTYGKKKNTKNT